MNKIEITVQKNTEQNPDISFLDLKTAEKVLSFHKSFPQYEKTPLANLKNFAKKRGIKDFYIKDESYRFGLNAFKVLGGSFAIGNYIANRLGKDISEMPYDKLISDEVRNSLGEITFASATDGNHGRGVAWTANKLKQKCRIYMPKGSAEERLENIRKENAEADIYDYNYDDCVRLADKFAKEHNGILVQDTSWDG